MSLNTVWARDKLGQKNCGLVFYRELFCKEEANIKIRITASNLYKLYVGKKLIGCGPARAAHGYARIDEYECSVKNEFFRVCAEVVSYRVNSYCYIDENPFFACEIIKDGKVIVRSQDFICFELTDKVQKVQRYSFQRPFIEVYRNYTSRWDVRNYGDRFKKVPLVFVKKPKFLSRGVEYVSMENSGPFAFAEKGSVYIDEAAPLWKDRSIDEIGDSLKGYRYEELEEKVSDEVSRFVYLRGDDGKNEYSLFDGGRVMSGYIDLHVKIREKCKIYIIFDELIERDEVTGCLRIDCFRMHCCNALKYSLDPGEYNLSTAEVYALRYANVIRIGGGAELLRLSVTKVERPKDSCFTFEVEDSSVAKLLSAACNSYRQNAIDIFMDCPSRERAGWNNDSYFTAQACMPVCGNKDVEKNHIENLILAPQLPQIPKGMIPMCYPCDHLNGVFIPNCAMWMALQMCDYAHFEKDRHYKKKIKPILYRLLKYFRRFENEDELLENLEGWVFVEWGRANDEDFVCGVNYPSNMTYCGLLKKMGALFSDEALRKKSERIRAAIIRQSYNGEYFEDNRVRKNGGLCATGHRTEACQYYAFYFGIANPAEFPSLYREISERRFNVPFSERETANIIVGLTLRFEILMRNKETRRLLAECKNNFGYMADLTDTLWEHKNSSASCNHGIGSIVAKWVIYALTGARWLENGSVVFDDVDLSENCKFVLRDRNFTYRVSVYNRERSVEIEF